MISSKCYVGVEAEGPHYGNKMLFVPGDCEPDRFKKVWEQQKANVDGVYFGAGGNRYLNADTLKVIRDGTGYGIRIVETITIQGELLVFDLPNGKIYRKYETDTLVVWEPMPGSHHSLLSDPNFATDQEVEE
jgi:hypothetical protein